MESTMHFVEYFCGLRLVYVLPSTTESAKILFAYIRNFVEMWYFIFNLLKIHPAIQYQVLRRAVLYIGLWETVTFGLAVVFWIKTTTQICSGVYLAPKYTRRRKTKSAVPRVSTSRHPTGV
jgi:hypothetical protein